MLEKQLLVSGPPDDVGEPADRQAILALSRGDRKEALTILMRAYGLSIYRYCYKVLRDRSAADDIQQTVFLQAYEDLEMLSQHSSVRAWLFSIAHHRCLDALKSQRRRQTWSSLYATVPDSPDPGVLAEDALAERTILSALGKCLNELRREVRMLVLLRYRKGFTYAELAEIFHEQPATLQARVARAISSLRKCLEHRGLKP